MINFDLNTFNMPKSLFLLFLLFIGCESREPGVPAQLVRVVIDSIPQLNGTKPWDPNDGPDIQLEVLLDSTIVYLSNPNRYTNSISGPYTFDFDPPIKYISDENIFNFLIYDIDTSNSKEKTDSFIYFSPAIPYSPWSITYFANSHWTFVVTYQ